MQLGHFDLEQLLGVGFQYKNIPPWLGPLGVTGPALERLKIWYQAGQPTPSDEAYLSELKFVGGTDLYGLTVEVLKELPAPLAHHVVNCVAFVCIGKKHSGFAASTLSINAAQRPRLIAMSWHPSLEQRRFIIVHEICHTWLDPTPDVPYLSPAQQTCLDGVTTADLVKHPGLSRTLARIRNESARKERLVDRLCHELGFPRPAPPVAPVAPAPCDKGYTEYEAGRRQGQAQVKAYELELRRSGVDEGDLARVASFRSAYLLGLGDGCQKKIGVGPVGARDDAPLGTPPTGEDDHVPGAGRGGEELARTISNDAPQLAPTTGDRGGAQSL